MEGDGGAQSFEVFNGHGRAAMVIVCDHATNAIPASLADLGLGPADLRRHIAWDPGSAKVARQLAQAFDAPLILSGVSRLVIDCNRDLHDPTLICAISDGTVVAGNCKLAPGEIQRRIDCHYTPYHAVIAEVLDAVSSRLGDGEAPFVLSVHSFTPEMDGFRRPWQIGVLWDRDPRIAVPLIENLAARGLVVGDNEPYSARHGSGYTMRHHAARRGFPHVMIELRQDLVADAAGQHHWAALCADVLRPIIAQSGPFKVEHY